MGGSLRLHLTDYRKWRRLHVGLEGLILQADLPRILLPHEPPVSESQSHAAIQLDHQLLMGPDLNYNTILVLSSRLGALRTELDS